MKPYLPFIILTLSACSSVVPSGIARLYQASPLESDPADMAVALDLPDDVAVKPGTAKISFFAERTDTGANSEGVYPLQQRIDPTTGFSVLSVRGEDQAALRTQQVMIREWQRENEDATKGGISVAFEGCRTGLSIDATAPVSVLLRTEADGRFFALVKDAPLKEVLQVLDMNEVEPC